MMMQQTNSGKAQTMVGMVIVAVGILVLAPKFIALTPLASDTMEQITDMFINALPSIGLGALHAGQALAFEPASFFAGLLRNLLSFWPLLMVGVGVLMMRTRWAGGHGKIGARENSSAGSGR
jgi:hypothetical protein